MVKTKLGFTKFDKDFNKLSYSEQPMRSWLIAFWNWMYAQMSDSDLAGCREIGNTLQTISSWSDPMYGGVLWGKITSGGGPGGEGESYFTGGSQSGRHHPSSWIGIVVGSNNAAVTPTQYALSTLIANGRAGGQILYGGCEVANPSFADPNGEMIIRRFFTNVSGGDVTVQEVGIYQMVGLGTNTYDYHFCIARDVVAPAVVVADTEILMVTYTVQITV